MTNHNIYFRLPSLKSLAEGTTSAAFFALAAKKIHYN